MYWDFGLKLRVRNWAGPLAIGAAAIAGQALAQGEPLPNACPVDGCTVRIVEVAAAGGELLVTMEANFDPDISKNHIHVWWGDNYTVEQVSNNAETTHHVEQGEWHPTDEYPAYTTQSAASVSVRGDSTTLCVSPADRNHDIIDVKVFQCMDVSGLL